MKHVIYTLVAMIAFTSLNAHAVTNRVYTKTVVKQQPASHDRPIIVKAQAPKKSVLDDYDDMGGADYDKEVDTVNRQAGVKTYYTVNTIKSRVRAPEPIRPPTKSIFRLAPYGGYVNTAWSGAKQTNASFSTMGGYVAGMSVLIGDDALHFETGVQYAERGANFSGQLKTANGVYTTTLGDIAINNKYIEIPAYARYNVVDINRVQVYAKAGFVLGLLQSTDSRISNVKTTAYYGPYIGTSAVDVNQTTGNELNNSDPRWAVGAGTNVRVSRMISWSLDGNYERSMSVINKAGDNDTYLSGFLIRTGLVFDL